QGADSIFLTGHPPHGTKPDRQRGSRILKNRPRRHRDLMPATGTLPASRSQRPRFGLAAARTAKPFWPAQAEQIVPAVLLAAESSFEFRQCPRIVLLQLFHKPPHYLLWLPESSGYPKKTEFGFDVLEVAQGRYAPDSYHDFIGFAVSVPLLEQAFQETYGLDLKSVLSDEDKVLGSYRHDVSQLLPKATRIAWSLKKDQIMKDQPGMTKKKFLYNLSRASYQKTWGNKYQPPTLGERFLAFLVRLLPKIGPLRVLQLRTPTPETERMFEASFNASLNRYRKLLDQVGTGQPDLPNYNFDTGEASGPGKYRLNDETHAKLLDALAKQNFSGASPAVRAELHGSH